MATIVLIYCVTLVKILLLKPTFAGNNYNLMEKNCGNTYTDSSGWITSPNYPQNYPNGLNCFNYIRSNFKATITITFTDFDIEPSTSCDYDYLRLRNAEDITGGEYLCGDTIPEPTVFITTGVDLLFSTDSTETYSGYNLTYEIQEITTVPQITTEEFKTTEFMTSSTINTTTTATITPTSATETVYTTNGLIMTTDEPKTTATTATTTTSSTTTSTTAAATTTTTTTPVFTEEITETAMTSAAEVVTTTTQTPTTTTTTTTVTTAKATTAETTIMTTDTLTTLPVTTTTQTTTTATTLPSTTVTTTTSDVTPTTTTTTIPTTTTGLPTNDCDLLTGKWESVDPAALLCLDVDLSRQGEVIALIRTGVDTFWVELVGRTLINDYTYLGLSGLWPFDLKVESFTGECYKCDGKETLILDALVKENSNDVFCQSGGQVRFGTRYNFTRLTSGLCQEMEARLPM